MDIDTIRRLKIQLEYDIRDYIASRLDTFSRRTDMYPESVDVHIIDISTIGAPDYIVKSVTCDLDVFKMVKK